MDPGEMEARLRAYYAAQNPGKEQNIATIVRKYRGKEAALCAKLRKKYGVAPDLEVHASSEETRSVPADHDPSAEQARLKTMAEQYRPDFHVHRVHVSTIRPETLDFRSKHFDALQSLHARHLAPLVAVHPLDNIHKCRSLLPPSDPNHQKMTLVQGKRDSTATARSKASFSSGGATTDTASRPRVPSMFDALADTYLEGPFTVLRRCFLERQRVRVVMRRVNSVRGTCIGYLKAFDKHMNLVLLDVTLTVIPFARQQRHEQQQHAKHPKQGAILPLFSVADPRRNRAFTTQEHAHQLFIRGDNVVLITPTPEFGTRPPSSDRAPRRQ